MRDLLRNLRAGARVIFGRPVTLLSFRIGVPQLLVLILVSALLDIAVDALRVGPGGQFAVTGLVGEGFFGALLLLFAALLALAFRQPGYALALPIVVLAGEWPLQVARMLIALAVGDHPGRLGAGLRAEQVVQLWTLFWLWRSAAVSLSPRRPRSRNCWPMPSTTSTKSGPDRPTSTLSASHLSPARTSFARTWKLRRTCSTIASIRTAGRSCCSTTRRRCSSNRWRR